MQASGPWLVRLGHRLLAEGPGILGLVLTHWWVGLIVGQLLAISGGVTRAGAGLLEESTSFNFF